MRNFLRETPLGVRSSVFHAERMRVRESEINLNITRFGKTSCQLEKELASVTNPTADDYLLVPVLCATRGRVAKT